jgi:hypothetical protein
MSSFRRLVLAAGLIAAGFPLMAVAQTAKPSDPPGTPATTLEGTQGQSGPANNSGMQRPGSNPQAGNSATVPQRQQEQPAGTGTSRTEGPSLEQRSVGPSERPDQTRR